MRVFFSFKYTHFGNFQIILCETKFWSSFKKNAEFRKFIKYVATVLLELFNPNENFRLFIFINTVHKIYNEKMWIWPLFILFE